MIIVTGASGALGSSVIEHLLGLAAASEVAASVRDPNAAQSLRMQGVDVRHGDFDAPDTLERAFTGADRLLLVSASGIDRRRFLLHKNAIDAASRAGVGHLYYTSLSPGDCSYAAVMQAHLDTEVYLRESGIAYTILRNGVYMEAWRQYLGDISHVEAAIPADGPICWVSREDIAEGTARLLAHGGHAGETLLLTGLSALDLEAVCAIVSDVGGRPVVRRIVGEDEYVRRLVEAGKPEDFARQWATTYRAMARGEFAAADPFLGRLLGRELISMEQVLRESLAEERSTSL